MGELEKILSVKHPKNRTTLAFLEQIRKLLSPESFTPTVPADRAFSLTYEENGLPVRLTVRAAKRCIRGDVLFTQHWTRTVRYSGTPESDDSYIAATPGGELIKDETRFGLDGLPPELKEKALALTKELDKELWKEWKKAVQSFLDYYDMDDWDRVKEDIPDLDIEKAKEELSQLLQQAPSRPHK